MPERLGRVDVAKSGDDALIEQHRLDRTALLRQHARASASGVSAGSLGSGPSPSSGGAFAGCRSSVLSARGSSSTTRRVVAERDRRAREARQVVGRAIDESSRPSCESARAACGRRRARTAGACPDAPPRERARRATNAAVPARSGGEAPDAARRRDESSCRPRPRERGARHSRLQASSGIESLSRG